MKTVDEILEGVTAGGQWHNRESVLRDDLGGRRVADFMHGIGISEHIENAAYAAWAARHAPSLVRALEKLVVMHATTEHWIAAVDEGNAALAEALKD